MMTKKKLPRFDLDALFCSVAVFHDCIMTAEGFTEWHRCKGKTPVLSFFIPKFVSLNAKLIHQYFSSQVDF